MIGQKVPQANKTVRAGYMVDGQSVLNMQREKVAKIIGSFACAEIISAGKLARQEGAKFYFFGGFRGQMMASSSYAALDGKNVAVAYDYIYVVKPLPGHENDAAFRSPPKPESEIRGGYSPFYPRLGRPKIL